MERLVWMELWKTPIVVATGVGVFVSLIGVFVSLKGIRRQLWLQTFSEYTRRYSEIMDGLAFEARRPGGHFDFNQLPSAEREQTLGVMRRYFNLCSEEQYLHKRGTLDNATWAIWRTGIMDTVSMPCFPDAWKVLRQEYRCYDDFCTFIDGLVKDAAGGGQATTG